MNGVRVGAETRKYHTFDNWVPWPTPWDPNWDIEFENYKKQTTSLINKHTVPGDNVCVIGGGYGVTAIKTAESVGESGHVTVYEASSDRYEIVKKTVDLNDIDNVDCVHALVGSNVSVAGDLGDADIVDPRIISDMDVLELDCEGAEIPILESLSFFPRLIIVETHPRFDSPTGSVRDVLESLGYEIVDQVNDPVSGAILVGDKIST